MKNVTQHPYDHINPWFIRAISQRQEHSIVLDVGCWNGALGHRLMESCSVTIDGIERDPTRAEEARKKGYRRVDVIDLNAPLPKFGGRDYDFILFGDVVEHLLYPEIVLYEISKILKPSGRVLVSIPNIAFFANRLSHLFGNWDYQDYGILDRTHLHFFTKRTMLKLLQEAGLRVTRMDGYVGLYQYPWLIREPLRFLARCWPNMFAIQIVLEAELLNYRKSE